MSNKLKTSVSDMRTICEVHREIYDLLHDNYAQTENFDIIIEKLEEAYLMAKRMNAKLRQYKFDYDKDWWEKESEQITKQKTELRSNRKLK